MEDYEEIEIKNLCPMIAMISAGKTSLLKVLFDIDILESSPGIGTKFVTIIRYNPNLKDDPKFYQLKLTNIGGDNYTFAKIKSTEIVGKENIKENIIKLNAKLKLNDVPFNELFYLLELGNINFIEDKYYLLNYDLVDIPGVSEYISQEKTPDGNTPTPTPENDSPPTPIQTPLSFEKPNNNNTDENLGAADIPLFPFDELNKKKTDIIVNSKTVEEEMKTYNPDEEKSYLTEIFKIIKNKMNNGIFVFSVENYQHIENYRIIGKLQKIINKPIQNFLLILNKIDKSENIEYDINMLGNKILEYFPNADIFNFTKNTIATCSTFQLENEFKMEKNFKNLVYYHFLNFLMNSQKNLNTTNQTTCDYNFVDYLKKILNNVNSKIDKKNFYKDIENVINNRQALIDIKSIIKIITDNHQNEISIFKLGIREDDFEGEEIKNIEDEIKNEEGEEEDNEESFNISDQPGNMIILYYYNQFIEKKQIPPKSLDTIKIMKYFTMENMKNHEKLEEDIEKEIESKLKEERIYNDQVDDISKKLKEFYDLYEKEVGNKNNLDSLKIYIHSSIGLLKTSKTLYIPLVGVSNAGKSTVLNSIIGTSLLPSHRNECTKKGILIRHWNKDFAIIRKTKFIKESMYTGKDVYSFKSEEKIIAKGNEDIYKILEGINGKFTDKEEDFFYEINIRIKLIDKLKIDEKLKEKICFIDLPGFGTNNPFEEKDTYSHLIVSCNIFLFVVFNLKILEKDNQEMLKKLYTKMADLRNIPCPAFINKCLFIINCDQTQKITDDTEKYSKNDIIKVFNLKEMNIDKKVNVCFFNAKFYESYNSKLKYYKSIPFLFEEEYKGFMKSQEQFWKGYLDKIKGKTYLKYLSEKLKENIRTDIITKFDEKKINIDSGISDLIEKIIKDHSEYKIEPKKNGKDLTKINKYLAFASNNLKESILLKQSYIESFSENLVYNINIANNKEEEDIDENLNEIFRNLDFIFQNSTEKKYGALRDAPISKNDNFYENIFSQFKEKTKNISNSMNVSYNKYDITKLMTQYLRKIKESLIKEKNNLEEYLKKEKWKEIEDKFENVFKNYMNNLKKELLEYIEGLSKDLRENYNNFYNILKDLVDPGKPSDLLLTNFISKKLGRNNNIEKSIDDIIDDIIDKSRSCTYWKYRESFVEYFKNQIFNFNYLNKIIDSMIEHSCIQIEKASQTYDNLIKEFRIWIEHEISVKKEIVTEELERKKSEEEYRIKAKNEEERKKWEEEKRIYEQKKKDWENICEKYFQLKSYIMQLRFGRNKVFI